MRKLLIAGVVTAAFTVLVAPKGAVAADNGSSVAASVKGTTELSARRYHRHRRYGHYRYRHYRPYYYRPYYPYAYYAPRYYYPYAFGYYPYYRRPGLFIGFSF